MSVYYVMATEYAEAFNNPSVAKYDQDRWAINGDAPSSIPSGIEGEPPVEVPMVDLSNMVNADGEPWGIEQYVALVDKMRTETPTGRCVIIPQWVGQHLYANHPAFMPASSDNIE